MKPISIDWKTTIGRNSTSVPTFLDTTTTTSAVFEIVMIHQNGRGGKKDYIKIVHDDGDTGIDPEGRNGHNRRSGRGQEGHCRGKRRVENG